jgi:Tfp pilus assembly protein PilN
MQRNASLQRKALIDLNVLPAALRPHRYPAWYVAGMAVALAGLVCLAPTIMIQRSATQETERLRGQLAVITGQLEEVGMDVGQVRGLRMQLDQSEASLAALQSERKTLLGLGRPLSGGVSLLYSAAPPGLRVDSVTRSESMVTISGTAPDAGGVTSYARALGRDGAFSEVTIAALTEGDAGQGASALTFSIRAVW